jgi:hypothetical protein
MANSLIGRAFASLPNNINKNYVDMVYEWQDRVKHNHMLNHLGYVPGSIMHHYHGPKVARGYQSRWGILQKYDFNPIVDINKDYQGIIKLTKPGLRMRTDLIKYFSARNEDDIRED